MWQELVLFTKTCVHSWYPAELFLEWEVFQPKVAEKIQNSYVHWLFFQKLCHLWDTMEKYGTAIETTDENMAHALCRLDNWSKITNTKLYNNQCIAQVFNLFIHFTSALHDSGFLLAHLQRQVYNFGVVQVFWVWYQRPGADTIPRRLDPHWNCTPASEDGLKESPNHVRWKESW
jgi:hypothetical protein